MHSDRRHTNSECIVTEGILMLSAFEKFTTLISLSNSRNNNSLNVILFISSNLIPYRHKMKFDLIFLFTRTVKSSTFSWSQLCWLSLAVNEHIKKYYESEYTDRKEEGKWKKEERGKTGQCQFKKPLIVRQDRQPFPKLF